jgi:environmental stress-induced protein Ves
MRILRAENYHRMKWKNGGGETAEIAVSPEGAGLDGFDWRVSMATVEASGPFSLFPGVDRTLSVLEGEGIVLDVDGQTPVTLTAASAPYSFPADAATNAKLVGGPIRDLNVMTRRGRWRHQVSVRTLDGSRDVPVHGKEALLFSGSDDLLAGLGGGQARLGRFDAVVLNDPSAALRIEGSGQFFVIEFSQL